MTKYLTSDGIPLLEWQVIRQLAEEYAALTERGDKAADRVRRRLLRYLDRLVEKYGELPSILATKSDYLLRSSRRESLLIRAYELARRRKDTKNLTLVSASLAELYIEELNDTVNGRVWIARLKKALTNYPDAAEGRLLRRLHSMIGDW